MTSNNKLLDLAIGDWEEFFCTNLRIYGFGNAGLFFEVNSLCMGPMPSSIVQLYADWLKNRFTGKLYMSNPGHNIVISSIL